MAWDPTQGQEQPGNGEQGQPANGGPEPNPGYSAPQNPNEGQGQPASGADPHSGYGTPQNPYGAPPPQILMALLPLKILMPHHLRKTPMALLLHNTVPRLINRVVMDMHPHSKRLDQ